MQNYIYKCIICNHEYQASDIEDSLTYLCPGCGKAEKNRPLEGVLQIVYDYHNIKKNLTREEFLKYPNGKFWLYPRLWPLAFKENNGSIFFDGISERMLEKLSLNGSSFQQMEYNGHDLFIQDETRNPTLSFKDRASIITAVKAIQLGVKEISAASTGNAGSSLAGICARLGINSHIFVPSSIPASKRIQIQSFGANIYIVQGTYDDAFDLSLDISDKKKWYSRNTGYNPLTIEGKKWGAYDIFLSSNGNVPGTIFIPIGDGVIISGIYKGFLELHELGWIERMPNLIGVQAEGSDALVRYLKNGYFEFIPPDTIADSISAGAPRNLYMAASAIKNTQGKAIAVNDHEILAAQKKLAAKGILTEPSSAAAFAGYINMYDKNEIDYNDNVLLLITGNGLKDVGALNKWNTEPPALSYNDWLNKLL